MLLLEFSEELLHLAEASFVKGGVQLNHISSMPLPPEALDRGVPAEPAKMAGLIKELCAEKKIPAHRVAVVLPPEVAFQRLVDLPDELKTDEARDYVLDPANGLQLPFPLAKTDFDLFPVSTPSISQRAAGMRLYMLTAIPQVLVDRVIEMLQAADLELQMLELGSFSQLRSLALDLVMLRPQQVELVLELLPDYSNLMLVTCSGLLGSERLVAIRDFPEPDLDKEQTSVALEAGLSAESFTMKDEKYLPISAMDLRVLIADLKRALARFNEMFSGAEIRCLRLTGINSAHPMLVDLFKEALGLPVFVQRPLLAAGIAGFSSDQVLVQTGLGRLVGLALGLLPHDQLVSCPLDGADRASPSRYDAGVTLEKLLDFREQNSGLEITASTTASLSPSVDGSFSDHTQALQGLASDVANDPTIGLEDGEGVQEADHEDETAFRSVLDLLDESEGWPSIGDVDGIGGIEFEEGVEEVKVEEVKAEGEWLRLVILMDWRY